MNLWAKFSRRSDVSLICAELNRRLGGNYFSEVRSCSCDSDGFWRYYISQVCDCPDLKFSSLDALFDEVVSDLISRGCLHA